MMAFAICAILLTPHPRPLIHPLPCPGHHKKAKRYLFGLFNRQQSSTCIISAWAAVDKLFIGTFSQESASPFVTRSSGKDYFKATRKYDSRIGNVQ